MSLKSRRPGRPGIDMGQGGQDSGKLHQLWGLVGLGGSGDITGGGAGPAAASVESGPGGTPYVNTMGANGGGPMSVPLTRASQAGASAALSNPAYAQAAARVPYTANPTIWDRLSGRAPGMKMAAFNANVGMDAAAQEDQAALHRGLAIQELVNKGAIDTTKLSGQNAADLARVTAEQTRLTTQNAANTATLSGNGMIASPENIAAYDQRTTPALLSGASIKAGAAPTLARIGNKTAINTASTGAVNSGNTLTVAQNRDPEQLVANQNEQDKLAIPQMIGGLNKELNIPTEGGILSFSPENVGRSAFTRLPNPMASLMSGKGTMSTRPTTFNIGAGDNDSTIGGIPIIPKAAPAAAAPATAPLRPPMQLSNPLPVNSPIYDAANSILPSSMVNTFDVGGDELLRRLKGGYNWWMNNPVNSIGQ